MLSNDCPRLWSVPVIARMLRVSYHFITYVFQQLMLLRLLESNASQERATKMFLNTQIYTD